MDGNGTLGAMRNGDALSQWPLILIGSGRQGFSQAIPAYPHRQTKCLPSKGANLYIGSGEKNRKNELNGLCGLYWVRTSDPCPVKAVL